MGSEVNPASGRANGGGELDPDDSSRHRFIGRATELALLEAGLRDASNGHGRLFMVIGEPGIGKTRLADELAKRASSQGFGVYWGSSWEGHGAPVYWPWIQILRGLIRARGRSLVDSLGPHHASLVARILPELSESGDVAGRDPPHAFAILDAIVRLLKEAARKEPIALIVDDLHVADQASVSLLHLLVKENRDTPLLAYVAYRAPELHSQRESHDLIANLEREALVLRLIGLSQDEVREMMQGEVGTNPHPTLVAAVHRTTEGNPLFVSQTTRLLVSEGQLDRGPMDPERLPISPGVRQTIRQRLQTLSSDAQRILEVASVVGREFELGLLQRASGVPGDRLVELIDEIARSGLIAQPASMTAQLSFSHGLVRETVYEDQAPTARLHLHRKIAHLLEEMYGDDPTHELSVLAHHFSEAAPLGEVEKALDYTTRAAERAMEVFASTEAAARFAQALQLLQFKDKRETRTEGELLLSLGTAQNMAGQIAQSQGTLLKAAEVARSLDDPEMLARAAAGYGRETTATGKVDRTLVSLLEEALDAIGPEDSPTRVDMLTRLAMELYYSDESERRVSLSRDAVEVANRLGDAKALSYAIEAAAHAAAGPDNLEQRLEAGEQVIRIAKEMGRKEAVPSGQLWILGALLERGDIPGWERVVLEYERAIEDVHEPAHQWYATMLRAMRAIMEGRFREGNRLARDALELGEQGRGDEARHYHSLQILELFRQHGGTEDLGSIDAEIDDIMSRATTMPVLRAVLANVNLQLGRIDAARTDFERVAANEFARLPKDLTWLASIALLAEVCLELEDHGRARVLYHLLHPYARRNVVLDWSIVSLGSAEYPLGLLAEASGLWSEALNHLRAAEEENVRMGARPFAAHSRLGQARVLMIRDDPGDAHIATETALAALQTYRELEMGPHVARAITVLAGLGAAPPDEHAVAALPARPAIFRKDGDYWSVTYEGDAFRLKDAKGLAYLARLLAEPGREFHALDLFTASAAGTTPRAGDDLHADAGGSAGALLDPKAKEAYRRRLADLEEDAEEAEAANDPERAAKAREERDFLVRELAAAVGLGGRDRPTDSAAERARVNVTKAVRTAIGRITEHSAALGQHLDRTVRTGTFCSYQPDPRAQVGWRVST